MSKEIKTERIQLRSEPAFVDRVQTVAQLAGYPSTAEMIREAVDEKIEKLAKRFPQIKESLEMETATI